MPVCVHECDLSPHLVQGASLIGQSGPQLDHSIFQVELLPLEDSNGAGNVAKNIIKKYHKYGVPSEPKGGYFKLVYNTVDALGKNATHLSVSASICNILVWNLFSI